MRLTRMAGGAALVLVTAFGGPAAAGAATAGTAVPWQPYTSAPWTDAPGAVCTFGITTSIVYQNEQFRTLASYPNGNPKLQEFRGPLYVQYTNTSTGESAVRNLSGIGWFHYGSDGSLAIFIPSGQHFDATVPVGNTGAAPGEWVINGPAKVTVSAAGSINIDLLNGTGENLCQSLS